MASGFPSAHQRKLGPAPIASFEDLSDENQGTETAPASRMPGIIEVTTPQTPASSLKTPSTPRIDISRASSSSHHEEDSNSRESTPEKELLGGNAPPEGSTLQLGYKEDVEDLRSSTEDLDLHDPVNEQDQRRESKRNRRRAKDLHDGTQSEHGISIKVQSERERKDSNCSEIVLLNISGRTSRLSSVGSQGSGVSGGALSVVSATSSRSPSPHKCLLETSFCGSVSTLDSTLIEPSKPENDDLAKMLLLREEDSTRAMIPESVRVPIVAGNIKPDPLDMPRRRGREERKEAFKREVEITKKVLKRVNIEVPIIKLPSEDETTSRSGVDVQKPASLDLKERRKRSPSSASTSGSRPGSAGIGLADTPKLQRHQKIRELEGSRTPSPSSVSRKSSFTSLFKGRADGASIQSQESPTTTNSRRASLASRLRDTAESLRSRSKSRERPTSGEKSPGTRKPGPSASGVFSSTLSLFRKRERKKSDAAASGTGVSPDRLNDMHGALDNIGPVEFSYYQQQTPSRKPQKEDVIFISLYGENDEFRNRPEKEEEEVENNILPMENVPLTHECTASPVDGDADDISSPQQTSANIVCTDVTIEHHRKTRRSERRREGVRISSSSGDSTKIPESHSRDSHISKSESRDSKIATEDRREVITYGFGGEHDDTWEQRLSTSSSKDSIVRKPDIPKPKRKSRTQPSSRTTETTKPEVNGRLSTFQRQSATTTTTPVTIPSTTTTTTEDLLLSAPVETGLSKTPSMVSDLDRNSSESERDSEIDFVRAKAEKGIEEVPDERKGLFYEESFEEDLPYVPTTLPLEKSAALPMLPVKQRLQEVRTTPIERPRSTTPINPQLLDEYIMHTTPGREERRSARRHDKMRISLPREDSFKLKSPHRPATQHTFTEFAERVPATRSLSREPGMTKSPSPPPPLPPRAPTTQLTTVSLSSSSPAATGARPTNWINFEEIPEKRKAPKRIQTIPRLEDESKHTTAGGSGQTGQYSYVQPEECRCECHEESRRASLQREPGRGHHHHHHHHHHHQQQAGTSTDVCNGGASCPAATATVAAATTTTQASGGSSNTNGDRSSIISDNSSLEGSLSAEYTPSGGHQHHLTTTTTSNGGTRPFAIDLDVSSNRSSIISQDETEDEHT